MHKDRQLRQLIVDLQAYMSLYGYQMLSTPIIENADLFLTKAGDQIAERLFTFERHGHNLALRPEFTASAAYLYVTQKREGVARWQFNGPVFEDNPQDDSGHYQQYSIGAELIGWHGTFAEAEVIGMAARGLLKQQINDWQLVMGHVGLTRHLLEQFALDARTQRFILQRRHLLKDTTEGKAQLMAQLDRYLPGDAAHDTPPNTQAANETDTQKMLDVLLDAGQRGDTMGGRTRHDIARRLLEKRRQATQRERIQAALDFLQTWINISTDAASAQGAIQAIITAITEAPAQRSTQARSAQALYDGWLDVLNLLAAYDVPPEKIIIQPDLARSWDYYTGIVFEIRTAQGLRLAGGGRYDELIRLIGGEDDVPAVGFAYYVDHLLKATTHMPPPGIPVYGLYSNTATPTELITWAGRLREHGLVVALGVAGDVTLRITADGRLSAGDESYTPGQINDLITKLREKQHDN